MEQQKFLECEYQSLREEIKQTKDRLFKLAGIGLAGMPSAYSIVKISQNDVLTLTLPILICTITLLYLSESRALMRCGSYIKEKIEPNIEDNEKAKIGWETWLSPPNDGEHKHSSRRDVDKFLAIFFYLLFCIYYAASVTLAATLAFDKFEQTGLALVLGFYLGIGIPFICFLYCNFNKSTSTTTSTPDGDI